MEWTDRSVLEAVSWRLASELVRRHPDTTRLIRGHPGGGQSDCLWILPTASEHGDIRLNRHGTIQVLERFHVWTLDGDSDPRAQDLPPTGFTTPTPQRWNAMLMTAADRAVTGLADQLGKQVGHPSLALYPKLSSTDENQPWQMRLDGLDVGRVGATTATLRLASRDSAAPGEPRDTWRRIVGDSPRTSPSIKRQTSSGSSTGSWLRGATPRSHAPSSAMGRPNTRWKPTS